MNLFFNIIIIAGPIFLLSLPAQASAEFINDSALCDATVAALKTEWDEDIENLPRDEKLYKERVEFAKLHRDLFRKTVTLYNSANHNELAQKAKALQRESHTRIVVYDLRIYLDPFNPSVVEEKDVVVIWSELISQQNGDVDFLSTICIGKEDAEKVTACTMYQNPRIPILRKGLSAPKTEFSASMVDDLMQQYIGPPPPNNPDLRDFIAKKLAEKHLYCPDYTPVAANHSNEKDALAMKASHFDGSTKNEFHNEVEAQKGKPLNLRKTRSASSEVAI